MTLDTLAEKLFADMRLCDSRDEADEVVRAALAQAERMGMERAAKILDSVNNYDNPMTANDCADAIRAEMETIK
jgi:hypothetical protein